MLLRRDRLWAMSYRGDLKCKRLDARVAGLHRRQPVAGRGRLRLRARGSQQGTGVPRDSTWNQRWLGFRGKGPVAILFDKDCRLPVGLDPKAGNERAKSPA
jgi:hypothetical protein